ncbi:hypothetical protein [Cohnella cholangitidis]|uniref:Uncharacterized protein n=1 Tax=Cohnella cholangitidis TaxID=2598458 RepID=A0A7G5BSS8_9BACL|nr:hypothetical protein [Cohnella cholangitidis]QMV40012.1 hypothetical protein FPL14_01430 [Cohnella cholangitidis]
MINKTIVSFVAVLFGFMSLGYIKANTNDYMPVPQDSKTKVAYIDRIYQQDGKRYLNADLIEWYEGEEANEIFRERERDAEMTEAPDGYYIVNDDPQLVMLEIADDAKVFMQIYNRTGNVEEAGTVWNEQITVDQFFTLMTSDDSGMSLKDYPYHFSVENDKIVKITQQFLP